MTREWILRGNGASKHVILIDEEDYRSVKDLNWCVRKTPKAYAMGPQNLYLHRYLMDAPKGLTVDHINGNSLDNRRRNLRVVSYRENCVNSKGWAPAKRRYPCPYKGVFRISRAMTNRSGRIWEAKIMVDGRQRYLGGFKAMEDGAKAYDNAARIYLPDTAYLNFPTPEETVNRGVL